jgi:sodium/potassium-transporting ATPase subunit alpha
MSPPCFVLPASESDQSHTESIDNEKDIEKADKFPRTETVRFDENNNKEDIAAEKGVSGAGIGLPRTLTFERPRYAQKNRVIGDFRTLSISLSEGGLATNGSKQKKGQKNSLKEIADLDWHKLSAHETLTRLGSSPDTGLDIEQAKRRLARDGPNVFSKPPNRWLYKVINYIFGGFGTILTGAANICFIAWRIGDPPQASNLALAIILCGVIVVSAVFNAWQDFSTSRVMESVRGMLPSEVSAIRNGATQVVPAADIVRGDIVNIKMGGKVPADCRVITIGSEMKFDRSSLTGESDAIAATIDITDDNYLETRNVLMAGTKCVGGEGTAIVTATGDATVFGRLAKLSSAPKKEKTTLEKEIFVFVTVIASMAFTLSIICIIIWGAYLRPKHPDFMNVSALLVNVASILVAFIPEGLPVSVSLSLTIMAARMRKAKVLVKSLSIVETLGAVNVVCSDKTGTLTQNLMAVRNCAVHGFEEDRIEEVKHHIQIQAPIGEAFAQLAWVAAVCNVAKFDETTVDLPLDKQNIFGDATDCACLRYAEEIVGIEKSNDSWTAIQQLAFNSKNKFAARLMEASDEKAVVRALSSTSTFKIDEQLLLLVKGAPDVLMKRCSSTLDASGQVLPLTEQRRSYLVDTQNTWANMGQRVLLLARKVVDKSSLFDVSTLDEARIIDSIADLTVVGLVGIVDPPRPEIPDVVKTVRRAGSRFFMVTGDFQATAVAIARQCGIVTTVKVMTYEDIAGGIKLPTYWLLDDNDSRDQRALSLTGNDIQKLQPEDWEQVCNFDEIVFSRTTPDQKLRIVKEFQQRNGVVAMTGDGVNDAPALKQADCGVSLSGASEVAIEAADLVLLESFSSFVDALMYGRLCFDNLKKTIVYLLPAGSFSELWPVLLSFFFGLPQILSNIQMILICVLTDIFPALSLVHEKPEADILLRKPRNTKKDRLANIQLLSQAYFFVGIILTVTSCAMAFWWLQRAGIPFSDMWLKYAGGSVQTSNPDYFNEKLYQAQSIYFFNLVISQYFNLHTLRTRRLSLFQQWPYWGRGKNLFIIPAILLSFFFALLFSYIPAIQRVFLTRGIQVEFFFLPFAWGAFILAVDELRKLAIRMYPRSFIAKLAW